MTISNVLKAEFIFTLLGQIIPMIGSVIILKQLAVYLNSSDYGLYALITSVIALLMVFPFGSLLQGISRYIPIYAQRRSLQLFLSKVFFHYSFIIFITFLASSLIYLLFIQLEFSLFLTMSVFATTTILKSFFLAINNSQRERKSIFLANANEYGIKIFVLFMIYHYLHMDVQSIFQIFILSEILSIIILYIFGNQKIRIRMVFDKKDKIIFLKVLNFSSPLIFFALLGWLRDMSGRWYINHFMSLEEVGIFSMLTAISMIIPAGLQGIIGAYIIPIIYEKNHHDKHYTKNLLLKIIPAYMAIIFFFFIVLYFFHSEIVHIVSDAKYARYSWMLPWLFLTYGIYSSSILSTYEIYAHKEIKKLFFSFFLSGIFALIMGYILIFHFGINGALYNFIGTYLIFSIATYFAAIKYNLSKIHKVGVA